MSRAQPTTNAPRLAINITRLVASQKQRHACDFVSDGPPPHWVELANFGFGVARSGGAVDGGCHASFGQARADGVTADGCAGELEADGLHEGDYGGFGGGVVGCERKKRV